MKSYYLLCVCSIILIIISSSTSFHLIPYNQKSNLKKGVSLGSIKQDVNVKKTVPDNFLLEPSFLENKSADLFDTMDTGLTPTVNIREGLYNVVNMDEATTFHKDIVKKLLKPRIINYFQKTEKVMPTNFVSPLVPTNYGTVSSAPKKAKIINKFISPRIVSFLHRNKNQIENTIDNKTQTSTQKIDDKFPETRTIITKEVEIKSSNFEKVNTKPTVDERKYKQPNIVRNLRKDYNFVKSPIPDSYQPVQHVKAISPAGAADLKIQEFYHE